MKARNAFLLGCAAAVVAVVAGLLTKNVMVFRKICDWVYFLAIVTALILFVTALNPRKKNKKTAPLFKLFANPADTAEKKTEEHNKNTIREKGEDKNTAAEEEGADAADKQQPNSKKYYEYALTMLLIGLPSLLAVLIEYYWRLIRGN